MIDIIDKVEIFHYPMDYNLNEFVEEEEEKLETGWYFWYCLPGCLPDGDPIGPFDSYQSVLDCEELNEEDE